MSRQTHSFGLILQDSLVIFAKELRNLLKDRRALVSILILPLVLVPMIFIGLDLVTGMQQEDAAESTYFITIEGTADPQLLELLGSYLNYTGEQQPDAPALTLRFPDGYRPGDAADVEILYDSSSQKSSYAASRIEQALDDYNELLARQLLAGYGIPPEQLEPVSYGRIDTAPQQAQDAGFIIMLIPFYILIYVFAGSMSVGMDTTAGEKERGSIAVILVNQVSRSSIALGKILYVLTVGVASSLMTFLGLMAAFSFSGTLFGGAGEFSSFPPTTLAGMLIIILMTSMLAASIIVLLGSLARTVKEASSYIMPIYIIVVVMGVVTMNMDSPNELITSIIPLANTVFVMKSALAGQPVLFQLVLLIIADTLCILALLARTAAIYNSEKILEGPAA